MDYLLRAEQSLESKNYPLAEYFLRMYTAEQDNNQSVTLMNIIREGYSLPPDFTLSENDAVQYDKRYLIIKAWGYGFWSEGHHLAGQLLLAELTHRIPVVLWGKNSLFRDPQDADSSGHFFRICGASTIEEISADASLFPPKWNHENLLEENVQKWEGEWSRMSAQFFFSREESVAVSDFYTSVNSIIPWIGKSSEYYGLSESEIYSEIFQHYLCPADQITEAADKFYSTHMIGRVWAAVHVRGSDKVYESPHLAEVNASYFSYVDRIAELNPEIGIYLMTDSNHCYEQFVQRYGDRILSTSSIRTSTNTGVHMSGHDGVQMGREVYTDTLIALKCDYFVGNQESNVSLAVSRLKNWNSGFCILLGASGDPTYFLHNREKQLQRCRLCGGKLHDVPEQGYFHCENCFSVQRKSSSVHTENKFTPFAASKLMSYFFQLPRLLEILGVEKDTACLDLNGDSGFLCSLLRDIGFSSINEFDSFSPVKLLFLFDSAERFVNPISKWSELTSSGAELIIGNADVKFHGSESPDFIYSPQAYAWTAQQFGWAAYIFGDFFVLAKSPISEVQGAALIEWNENRSSYCFTALREWQISRTHL